MKKLVSLICMVLAVAMLMSACGAQPASNEKQDVAVTEAAAPDAAPDAAPAADAKEIKKIGVSLYYQKDEWYVGVHDEFQKQGAERGYEVILADADASFEKQVEDVENLMNQNIDLLMVAPVSDDGVVSLIDDATSRDIPVLAYGTQPSGGDYFTYVGWDVWDTGYNLGKLAVEYTKNELNGKANVVMLEDPTIENLRLRAEGFRAALDESDVEVTYVATENYGGDREKAMNKMENILQTGDQIDIVFAAQDPGAFGARSAIEAVAGTAKVFSCGGYGDEVYSAFENNDPYIYADIIVSPYLFVKGIYDALDAYVAGEQIEQVYNIDIDVCTAQNYKEIWG